MTANLFFFIKLGFFCIENLRSILQEAILLEHKENFSMGSYILFDDYPIGLLTTECKTARLILAETESFEELSLFILENINERKENKESSFLMGDILIKFTLNQEEIVTLYAERI